MLCIEKQLIAKVRETNDPTVSELGLRFDRVVTRLIDQLHQFAARTVPMGTTVLVTITAPIRLPAKTAAVLEDRIETLLAGTPSAGDRKITINGNRVRIRVLAHSSTRAPKLLGFVHNTTSKASMVLDLVEKRIV